MNTVVFQVQGKKPDPLETEKFEKLSFGSGMPTEVEIKDAIKKFLGLTLAGIGMFFFGRWVISRFTGLGVLFFGYGFAYFVAPVCVFFGFYFLFMLFRPAHKSKASAALKWTWMTSILGEDAVGERFGKLPYSLSTMRRLLPQGTGFDETVFGEYVTSLRNAMSNAADETASLLKEDGWKETFPVTSCNITEEIELQPNLHELHATITYNDQLSKSNNNKEKRIISAMLELRVTQYYIRSGKYWFPYDITPSFQREPQQATASEMETVNESESV